MDNKTRYIVANLIGYIEGGFHGKKDQLSQGLVERANEVARAFQIEEIETLESTESKYEQ